MPKRAIQVGSADIHAIRQSLVSIVETLVRMLDSAQKGAERRSAPAAAADVQRSRSREVQRPRRRAQLSPARRAALRLQGEYMGRLRNLKLAQKAKVKAIRAKKGLPAAIKLAARLGRYQ